MSIDEPEEQKVYVLMGVMNYEGGTLLGVFKAKEAAEKIMHKTVEAKFPAYNTYIIQEEPVHD